MYIALPKVNSFNQTQLVDRSDSVTLNFHIYDALPDNISIMWYYTATTPAGTPDFNSNDFLEMFDSTPISDLLRSPVTVNNTILDIGGINSTTAEGRYYLVAKNLVGSSSNYTDITIMGKLYSDKKIFSNMNNSLGIFKFMLRLFTQKLNFYIYF